MANSIEIVHRSNKRVRLKYGLLKHNYVDSGMLAGLIESFEGVKSVRINKKAASVVLMLEDDSLLADTIEALRNVTLYDILDNHAENSVCISCVDTDEEASYEGIIKAAAPFTLMPFRNDTLNQVGTLAATTPLMLDGIKALTSEGVTSHVLESLAVGVSLWQKDYLAANSTNLLLEVGEYIEHTMVKRSDDMLRNLIKPNIEYVWIIQDDIEVQVHSNEISVGDIIIVNAGDTIPIDGHIVEGQALVNQASMTGESVPVEKKRGDNVLSGTVIEEGRLKIWAEYVGKNTATARVANYIQNSLNQRSKTAQNAYKLADKLVPMTLGLAGFAYVTTRDWQRVAAVLQADYSCALKLATPVAFKSTLKYAGENGMMIKGAQVLENLSEVDTVVFDKTGTLTYGDLEVEEVKVFCKGWSKKRLLDLAASAEEHYFHPVAEAVVKAAKSEDFVHVHHDEVEFIVSHGVVTYSEGKKVVIGSRHFLEDDEGITFSDAQIKVRQKYKEEGKILLFIGYDHKLLGMIVLNDHVREDAKETIQRLRDNGIKNIYMLTGDIATKAQEVGDELGIDKVYADLKPTDKAEIVKELTDQGAKVAFVGDGINDAPALINAHVGISMAKSADIATATADISLLKDSIMSIVELKILSDKTMKLIKSNYQVTVGANSAILLAATLGKISPITTSLLHNGTTVGLLIRAIRGVR